MDAIHPRSSRVMVVPMFVMGLLVVLVMLVRLTMVLVMA